MQTRETVEAWADITIKNWIENIKDLDIGDTGALANSFTAHVVSSAGGDAALVEFTFLYYGKFVDMGVGRGVTIADRGDKAQQRLTGRLRSPKKWYSKELYTQLQRLNEILAEKFGREAKSIIQELNNQPDIIFY